MTRSYFAPYHDACLVYEYSLLPIQVGVGPIPRMSELLYYCQLCSISLGTKGWMYYRPQRNPRAQMELGAGCHCVLGPFFRGDRALAFTALEARLTRNQNLHEVV